MKRLLYFWLLPLAIGSWLLSHPPIAHTAYGVADYDFPASVLFKNPEDDPSLICRGNTLTNACKEFVDSATVTCTDNQEFIMSALKDNRLPKTTSKTVAFGGEIEYLPNFATDTEAFIKDVAAAYTARYKNNLWDQTDNIGLLDSTCSVINQTWNYDKDTCYCDQLHIGTRLEDGSCSLNSMRTTKGGPRNLTLRQQFEQIILPHANRIKANTCSGGIANGICEPAHRCTGDGSPMNTEVAAMVPNTFEEYQALNSETKNLIQGCLGSPSQSSLPIFLVLIPEANAQLVPDVFNHAICDFLSNLPFNFEKCINYVPSYAMLSAPGLYGATKMANMENKIFTTLAQSKAAHDEITTTISHPIDYAGISTPKAAILKKAYTNKGSCSNKIPTMFMGGVYKPSGENETGINSSFVLRIKSFLQAAKKSPFSFRMYFVAPAETTEQDIVHTIGKNSIGNVLLTLKQRFKEVGTPTNLISSATPVNFSDTLEDTGAKPYLCDDDTAPEDKPRKKYCYPKEYVSFLDGQAPVDTAILKGGGAIANASLAMKLLPQGHINYHDTTCYYNEEAARVPQMRPLSLGEDATLNERACVQYLTKPLLSVDDFADICAVADKYKISCNILKAIWMLESNFGESGSFCTKDPSLALGPMQILPGSASDVTDDGETLDRCKLPDAFVIAARLLLYYAYGSYDPANANPLTEDNPSTWYALSIYSGCHNCGVSNQTAFRWGKNDEGKYISYCDAVKYVIGNNFSTEPSRGVVGSDASWDGPYCCFNSEQTACIPFR